MIRKRLPYNYEPRSYQLPVLQAFDSGIKRIVMVWHRRSGKEKTCVAGIVSREMQKRVGSYYYAFPEFNQGRKILWDGMDKDGFKFLDHFPTELLQGKPNDTEMKVKYSNGSIMQVIGTDDFNSVMGTNPVGIVFSEYSLQNPYCWSYFRPILAENGGWAIFNFTPRGENHSYDLYQLAKNDKNWFCQILTADDTGALSKEVLEQERTEIVKLHGNDALYQQEYFCNFTVPIAGAYYANQIMLMYQEGRVGNVPYEDRIPVDTWWDLGVNDNTSIWFSQTIGAEVRLIDYYQNVGEGFPHYAGKLKEKGYVYGSHNAPHDIVVKELGTGMTRLETAKKLGINFRIVPRVSLEDGIDSARSLFNKCWIDKSKCAIGINALKNYHKTYDDKKKTFLDYPYHDWTSNAADAYRYLAVGLDYTKSKTGGSYVKKEVQSEGWKQGAYVPPWAKAQEPIEVIR